MTPPHEQGIRPKKLRTIIILYIVKRDMKKRDAYSPIRRVRSKRRAIHIRISLQGINQTRKGVHELGRGWLFISPVKVWKSRNLLRLAYRKSIISKAEIHSWSICLLNMIEKV